MAEALRFFQQYEAVIYFALGVSAMVYGWRFWLAWQEVRGAIYGLELTSAQRRLNTSALMLFLLLVSVVVVFVLVTFFAPVIVPDTVLPIDPQTLEVESTGVPEANNSEEGTLATATPLPTVAVDTGGCIEGQLQILNPTSGQTLAGNVSLVGTVNTVNFGFYKIEYARAQEELWLTIQAGRSIVLEGNLVESWDTSQIPAGDYVLQLLVTDTDGNPQPPCRIPVRIAGTP